MINTPRPVRPEEPVPVVAILLPTGPELARRICSAWDAGAAALPLDPALPPAALARLMEELRPGALVDGSGTTALPGLPAPAGTAVVLPTSGTSGAPKGVVLTHANLQAAATASAARLGAEDGDRWLCCVPLHHVAGVGILARSRLAGRAPAVHAGFAPDAVAAEPAVTLVSLVPTMLVRLLEAGVDLRRFRRILLGGAPAGPALLDRARAADASVVVSYGATETSGGVVYDGLPLDGVQLRVAGRGGPGRIAIGGPTVMAGYRTGPQGVHGGWFQTGDLGVIGADGRLTVVGRADDMIVTGGRKVAPAEVEAVLAAHPRVADVAVAGVPDEEWGRRVTAFVVPAPGGPPTLDELRDLARARLPAHAVPKALVVVGVIPRTASGKPLRRALAAGGTTLPASQGAPQASQGDGIADAPRGAPDR
jgi:O-succinylbenzoic acid--CoA ligase